MSKADEAFEKWFTMIDRRNPVISIRYAGAYSVAWRAAWAEKEREDLAAVEAVKEEGVAPLDIGEYHGHYRAGYEHGSQNALIVIARRIKGDDDGQ